MIEGIHVDISSVELRRHLLKVADEHHEKALKYHSTINVLEKALDGEGDEGGFPLNTSSRDPVDEHKKGEKRHLSRRDYLLVVADHLIPNEVYRLSLGDLEHIEMVSSRY